MKIYNQKNNFVSKEMYENELYMFNDTAWEFETCPKCKTEQFVDISNFSGVMVSTCCRVLVRKTAPVFHDESVLIYSVEKKSNFDGR